MTPVACRDHSFFYYFATELQSSPRMPYCFVEPHDRGDLSTHTSPTFADSILMRRRRRRRTGAPLPCEHCGEVFEEVIEIVQVVLSTRQELERISGDRSAGTLKNELRTDEWASDARASSERRPRLNCCRRQDLIYKRSDP
jgi:hypothetical protein